MKRLEANIKESIYQGYLYLTHRLTNSQAMAILAIIVGLCAGIGAFIFNTLLHTITHLLTSWTPVDQAQWMYLVYPAIGRRSKPSSYGWRKREGARATPSSR